MAGYKPTLADIPVSSDYVPTLQDIPASYMLAQQAQTQAQSQSPSYPQIDTILGKMPASREMQNKIYGGTAPNMKDIQRAGATLLPGFIPEISGLGGGLNEYLMNALARTGAGSASNVMMNKPNINNLGDIEKFAKEGAKTNLMLESPVALLGSIGRAGEVYNPSYATAERELNKMNSGFQQAKQWQQQAYKPVFSQYGTSILTNDPEQFMQQLGITRTRLYPQAKQIYDDILQTPNLQNLHDFQSQLGRDISTARRSNKPRSEQYFKQFRQGITQQIRQSLSSDPKALFNYDLGTRITREHVEPYLSNPELAKMSQGIKEHAIPEDITSAIRKSREKITGKVDGEPITAIPDQHPLTAQLNSIQNVLDRGRLLQDIIPPYAKGFTPNFVNSMQNPYLLNTLRNLKPLYFSGGREIANQLNQQ